MDINFKNLNYLIKNINSTSGIQENKKITPDAGNSASFSSIANNSASAKQSVIPNNIQFNSLNRAQQALLIKALLSLPQDFKELLMLLMFKEISAGNLQKLLKNPDNKIPLQDIANMLSTNSKEVINKLLNLIQPTPGNMQNIEQFKELISLISQFTPSSNSTPHEILKDIILLYLPFIPLTQPQDISLKFEPGQSGGENQENVALVIYIITINLGRLKVILLLNQDNSITIEIEHEELDEEGTTTINEIKSSLNSELKGNNVTGKINSLAHQRPASKDERREVTIQPVSTISPQIMLAAFTVTKIVFEFDEKISLLKTRQSKIE